MANIMDYLDWRGDLAIAVDGFCEVDNLLLAQLVYVDFEGIVPAPEAGGYITLEDASETFWSSHDEEEILQKVSMTKSAPFVLKKMAQTRRFAGVRLSHYINDISDEEQSQFSAMCVELEDGSLYVSYSGTDNTIVGWRENFNMGFLAETPGQLKAVAYLNGVCSDFTGTDIRVGGHSKGGNLAVYASVKCRSSIQKRIVGIYSNDGPGFWRELVEGEAYQRMLPENPQHSSRVSHCRHVIRTPGRIPRGKKYGAWRGAARCDVMGSAWNLACLCTGCGGREYSDR